MSKRVVGIKSIINFFFQSLNSDTEKIIHGANKLIKEYNKCVKNEKKLVLCSFENIKSWLSIPKRIRKEIKGTELEKIFIFKFVYRSSYIKACRENYISETTFYSKMKIIYDRAINYMFYERLFIVGENELEAEKYGATNA